MDSFDDNEGCFEEDEGVNPLGRPEREGVKSDLREMEELRGFGAAGEGW